VIAPLKKARVAMVTLRALAAMGGRPHALIPHGRQARSAARNPASICFVRNFGIPTHQRTRRPAAIRQTTRPAGIDSAEFPTPHESGRTNTRRFGRMSVQLQANKPIVKVTPTELFDDALPKMLASYKSRGMKVSGTYEVNVFGPGGGRWFIDATQGVVRKADTASMACDCTLEMGLDEFQKMTAGTLDAPAAMRDGRVRFQGDIDRLVQLGHLLAG
jgi:hypothetical protein